MAFDLDPNYKQVPERIADFKEKHPDYPQGLADDERGDRCVCGGIRYWHGEAEGCDDCPCLRFELVKES